MVGLESREEWGKANIIARNYPKMSKVTLQETHLPLQYGMDDSRPNTLILIPHPLAKSIHCLIDLFPDLAKFTFHRV